MTKNSSTIQETRSPKVFAEPCPKMTPDGEGKLQKCNGQGKIYGAYERIKIDPETGERTQRRYVKCEKCGHKWGQDGPPASLNLVGDYFAGPCEKHPQHGDGRIAVKQHIIPTAVCDTCGHMWAAARKVEP